MFDLNIDYVMIGVLGIFMTVAFYILSKPSFDTIKEDEEARTKKMHHTPIFIDKMRWNTCVPKIQT